MSFLLCLEAVSLQNLQNPCAISLFPSLKLSFAVMAGGTWQQAQLFFPSSVLCSLALPLPCPLAAAGGSFVPCWCCTAGTWSHRATVRWGGAGVTCPATPLGCATLGGTASARRKEQSTQQLLGSSQIQAAQGAAGSSLGPSTAGRAELRAASCFSKAFLFAPGV